MSSSNVSAKINKQKSYNRFEEYLHKRKKEKGYLFIPYLSISDPDWDTSEKLVDMMIEIGADSIELGLPFTDPVADGPVLQRAFRRVIDQEFHMSRFYEFLEKVHKKHPDFMFTVMGYANIFYHAGLKHIFKKFISCNVGGVIIPDIPLEEKKKLVEVHGLEKIVEQISWIDFIVPTVPPDRLEKICKDGRGFLYFVSTKGVTGLKVGFSLKPWRKIIRKVKRLTDVPVVIGFGIREYAHALEAVTEADGFVIGSRIHEIVEENLKSPSKSVNAVKKEMLALLPEKKLASG